MNFRPYSSDLLLCLEMSLKEAGEQQRCVPAPFSGTSDLEGPNLMPVGSLLYRVSDNLCWRVSPSWVDLGSVPEPLAGVIGVPAGKPHPMRKDGSDSGLKRHSGHRLPQPVCWAVGDTSWDQAVQPPWLQKGKSTAWSYRNGCHPSPT